MRYSFGRGNVFVTGNDQVSHAVGSMLNSELFSSFENCYVFPGFCDAHVHLREPGFCYKETVHTGSLAAAHGGYTDIICMPNVDPVPDSVETMSPLVEAILHDSVCRVTPLGAITKGEQGIRLSEMESIASLCAGFSDDGHGVQDRELMRIAMQRARSLGKVISAHCEDNSLRKDGCVNDCAFAREKGIPIISSESEWIPVKRDLELARETGCKYHVCHVSTKESVELIRRAKADGIDVTCETAPHYLLLCDDDLCDDGRFKMNPPIRSTEDRAALIAAVCDGTVDMIATDHAPHSEKEKSGGLRDSLMGIVGLETAFPLLYTRLVKTGMITLDRLVAMMSTIPRKRFLPDSDCGFCVYDLNEKYNINPDNFLSKGRSTPFENYTVYGKCLMTVMGEKIIWQSK